jgi:hypothetical protein
MDFFSKRAPRGLIRLRIGQQLIETIIAEPRRVAELTFQDDWPWKGWVRVEIQNHDSGDLLVDEFPNLIVDAGRNLARDVLGGYVTDGKIRYVGVGTSSTAPAAGQTQLVAESFRKIATSYDNTIGPGQNKTTHYLAPGEANVNIQELGWFASPSAGAGANTGVMIARTLYSHNKNSGESISVQRTDSF